MADIAQAIRAAVAGGHAAKLIGSATALFEAGGKKLLSPASQSAVRTLAEKGAANVLAAATGPLLPPGLSPAKLIGSGARAAGAVVKGGARVAAREIAKGAGKAAGVGFVIDGAVATFEGVMAMRAGTMDKDQAVKHVVTEAATGAVATGTGVLLGAGLVALTGGAAAPVVFAVGALGAIGTKRVTKRMLGAFIG